MKNKKLILSMFCLMLFVFSFAQDHHQQLLDSFSGKLINAIRTHEKPRVYLVIDKCVYSPGESIWFKAFLINSVTQKINDENRFLYLDLVNEKDSVIHILLLDALNRQLNSRIVLPSSIPPGYYWLRAYTKQMAKTDTNSIYVKPICIVDQETDYDFNRSDRNNGHLDTIPAITFYPEGGSIITGVNSEVVLQAGNSEVPLRITGLIKDQHDAVITSFSTGANGFGKFNFEPSGYRKYRAVINWKGIEISYPLPSFNFYSGQMSVTKQAAGYQLRVLWGDSVYRKDLVTYVLGVSKDSLFFAGIGKGQYDIPVNAQTIPDGIATFYLFDEEFNLLSERSIYVPVRNVHISAATDKPVYGRHDKVTLNVSITDPLQHPVSSLFALSVSDTVFASPGEPCSLSEIYTGQPVDNIFLARCNSITDEEIDMLMLTLSNDIPPFLKQVDSPAIADVDSLLYIRGVVLNEKHLPSANKIITLLFNSNALILTDTTDQEGRFCFPLENYSDSTVFTLEARNLNGLKLNNNQIIVDKPVFPILRTPVSLRHYLPLQINVIQQFYNTYYDTAKIQGDKHLLPRVTLKPSGKVVNYDQSKRVSSSSTIITFDNVKEGSRVGNLVLNVSGMHILNGFLVINGPTALKAPDQSSEPILLVDGIEVGKSADFGSHSGGGADPGESSPVISYLNTLNPKDIDFIEILKGPEGANYGVRGGNGVILVNLATKRRDVSRQGNNLSIFYTKGVSSPEVFQNAGYPEKDANHTTDTDKRSTLFWNGSFVSQESKTATFTFYTGDIPGTYKVTVTGITVHGDFIYKTTTFQIK